MSAGQPLAAHEVSPEPPVAELTSLTLDPCSNGTCESTVDQTSPSALVLPSSKVQEPSEERGAETVPVYCCQKCRCILFTQEQLSSQHDEGQHSFGYRKQLKDSSNQSKQFAQRLGRLSQDPDLVPDYAVAEQANHTPSCSSLFLSEPNEWMSKISQADGSSGKLTCPKCSQRCGSFNWAGSQCSCGTWIVPALQFPASKLDTRVWKKDMLPAHCLDVVPFVPVEAQQPEETISEEEECAIEEAEEDSVVSPLKHRINRHRAWLELTNAGDSVPVNAMVDQSECSMTTVQKKCFEGFAKFSCAIEKSSKTLAGRVSIAKGPVAMPAPSTSSRALFAVEGIEGLVGEAICWSKDGKAQHILRVKNATDKFLSGGVAA